MIQLFNKRQSAIGNRKFFLTLFLCFLLGWVSIAKAGVSENDLKGLLEKLRVLSGIPNIQQELIVDPVMSRGYAAITWDGVKATIYVHPTAMNRESLNSWAFVLGHEIGHQVLNHSGRGGSQEEFAADIWGGQLAIKAGFDPKPYILAMFSRPNSCSVSHGCWHTRAENLESGLHVQVERPATYTSYSPTLGYEDHTNCECHGTHVQAMGPNIPVVTIKSMISLQGYEYVQSTGCIISQ
ncbi:hypothetical protein K1X84_10445 [bacterium]|nr:hypothetical protein [bacterium]